MSNNFFTKTLPTHTAKLISKFHEQKPAFLDSFYLSGGTALSLQLGHRESEDLDFFNKNSFDPKQIEQQLINFGQLSQTELAEGTLNTFLNSVQLQFLEYPYKLLEPTVDWEGIRLSSVLDIACTKLQTIGMRGSKKDFIDVYFLLEKFSLEQLFEATQEKYTESGYSETHILKSLIYFTDAEAQPMPRIHQDMEWSQVKNKIIQAAKSISLT